MESHDQKLQRLYDGELPDDEARELRARLTDADREKLLALEEIDQLVRNAVLKGGAAEAGGSGEPGEIDLWAGLSARLPPPPVMPMRRWTRRVTAVATVLSMAAVFAFFIGPWAPRHQTNHCEVESLEAVGATATVLQVPGENGDTTTVVWVDHQESDEWETL